MRTTNEVIIRSYLPSTINSATSSGFISNSGFTLLTAGNTYVLRPPVPGCMKTLAVTGTASVATVVRGATNGVTSITFDNAAQWIITFPATTVDKSCQLVGMTTARWHVLNASPYTTVAGTPSLGTTP